MKNRIHEIKLCGKVEFLEEGNALLVKSGDTVIVERGTPRLLVMRCPCGCGENLVINLDKRSGPAWRHYVNKRGLSLYPSYWRDTACGSHFILSNSKIYWCYSRRESDSVLNWGVSSSIENVVLTALSDKQFVEYENLADSLELTPWEVLQACRQLVKLGKATSIKKSSSEMFKKVSKNKKKGKSRLTR